MRFTLPCALLFRTRAALLAAALAVALPSAADEYPSRPITIVVAAAAGGNLDISARVLAPLMSKVLGQPVLVESRAGGGGMIGSAYVARATPDGYTLMVGSSGTNATAPAVNRNVTYDPIKSFTILGGITIVPSLLVVNPKVPATNFAELKKYAETKPEGVTFGSPGIGSFNHLTLELVKQKSGLRATHVPYKGAGQAMGDVVSSQIDGMFDQSSSSIGFVRDGRIKALAQLSDHRSALLPDVPTLAEQGVTGVYTVLYTALFAPANLPKPVEAKLVDALNKAKQDPAVQERFRTLNADMVTMDQAAFLQFATQEASRWREVAKANNIVVQD